jgi:malonate decarboxylase gamma subunit
MKWKSVSDRLFPEGHDIVAQGDFLRGEGRLGTTQVAVIGTTNHADTGVELALRMARAVLDIMRDAPGRPILFLVDTKGQRLRRRDELLGLNGYMAHLAKCVEMARTRGHRVVSLVYDQALSGGFLASGMMADVCAALPEAKIRVMGLPAMSRVTRIAESRLAELSKSSPVFAPGAENFVVMGGIDRIWRDDLSECLAEALRSASPLDERAAAADARGGRRLSHGTILKVLAA